jgi:hypothetical protein
MGTLTIPLALARSQRDPWLVRCRKDASFLPIPFLRCQSRHQVWVIPAQCLPPRKRGAGIHTQVWVIPAQAGIHTQVWVIPAQAGIHTQPERGIPAFAGMTWVL